MNVFSIDLEDWFHLLDHPGAPDPADWPHLPSRVAANTDRLLEDLDEAGVKATFFVLGWIAEHHPEVVRRVARAGHEIASHGHGHTLLYEQDAAAFRDDLRRAADAIDRACGVRPLGYRAPGFSLTRQTPWALEVLAEEGYRYDSSVFPGRRHHGGMDGADSRPHRWGPLWEIPVSTVPVGPTRLGWLGGGYLRLLPRAVVLPLAAAARARGAPLVLYVHPRDIDSGQPRLPMSRARAFRTYVGLGRCRARLRTLLGSFEWVPAADLVQALEARHAA